MIVTMCESIAGRRHESIRTDHRNWARSGDGKFSLRHRQKEAGDLAFYRLRCSNLCDVSVWLRLHARRQPELGHAVQVLDDLKWNRHDLHPAVQQPHHAGGRTGHADWPESFRQQMAGPDHVIRHSVRDPAPARMVQDVWRGLGAFFESYRWLGSVWATFFSVTGLHLAHVVSGVIALLIITRGYNRGRYDSSHVETAGLYWHFVDLVWMFVFPMMYLMNA